MHLEDVIVEEHRDFQAGYMLLKMKSRKIAPDVRPGQFVHVRIPHLGEAVLRRPFSVFKADENSLTLLYKDVGKGTHTLKHIQPGEAVSLIGPLGRPFPVQTKDTFPILIAGGYGMAALYLVARNLPQTGVAIFGGASTQDILCVEEFEALNWDVRVTTEDGSRGSKGIVTDALREWQEKEQGDRIPEFFACGPGGMLRAIGDMAIAQDRTAWLSVDENMGCGVGACLTCVVKVRTEDGGWTWARSCREGPVIESREIIWE